MLILSKLTILIQNCIKNKFPLVVFFTFIVLWMPSVQGCSWCLKVMETGGETGDCLMAERAGTAPGSLKMLPTGTNRWDMWQLKAFEISFSVYVACKTSIIIKTKESFPSKVVKVCVCVYLVQVCLAAVVASPLALVIPCGLPDLLRESAQQRKCPKYNVFYPEQTSPPLKASLPVWLQWDWSAFPDRRCRRSPRPETADWTKGTEVSLTCCTLPW